MTHGWMTMKELNMYEMNMFKCYDKVNISILVIPALAQT
jgi:hypothetical protein